MRLAKTALDLGQQDLESSCCITSPYMTETFSYVFSSLLKA